MAYPSGLPAALRPHWDAPWTSAAAGSSAFRSWLHQHGYLSPHFTKAEARCKDGTPVPLSLESKARDHAFRLEQVRHKLGDHPLRAISWYRTPAYNRRIGGARASRHMQADATDFSREFVESIGRSRFMAAVYSVFRLHGIGTYPWGAVHCDSRPYPARWNDWLRRLPLRPRSFDSQDVC
jgi:hypothetical protein